MLSEEYSAKSIRDFIYNFTYKKLKRSLRTHVEDASHTHYFGSEGSVDEKGANESTVDIIDLTTKSFRKIVRKPGTVSVFFIKLIRSFLRIDTSTLTSVLVIENFY